VELRSRHSWCRLGNPSIEGTTLVGIGKVLAVEDLSLPLLLDKRKDGESIVVVRDTVDESDRECGLRRGESVTCYGEYRGTHVNNNFSRCFNYFVNDALGVDIRLRG